MNLAQNRRFSSFYDEFYTRQTHGQKRRKKCFTHTLHLDENTQDFLQISATYTFLKKVLTSATF